MKYYLPDDIGQLIEFIRQYLQKIPDAKLMSPEFYTYHPALIAGKNAFWEQDSNGDMTGFAALFPPPKPGDFAGSTPDIWMIVLALPGLSAANAIRANLFAAVAERTRELKLMFSLPAIRLASDMMVSQQADIDFLIENGFAPFDQVLVMRWEMSASAPQVICPAGVVICPGRLESEEEKRVYLEMQHTCFPERSMDAESLEFLLHSPGWQQEGAIYTAYSAGTLLGSILLYRDEMNQAGVLDDVMVLPAWRGRGIAKALVAQGLQHYWAANIAEVRLEVRADNLPAIAVYTAMGFRERCKELLLGKLL